MIKISYEEIVSKIKEKAGIDENEISLRVEKKLQELSGLISRDGAAHIVANELGVKLFEQFTGRLQIKNILSGMRDVETVGKVLQIYDAREFVSGERTGKVGSVIIGDETDSIKAVLWGSQADSLSKISIGDIIKVVGGYVRDNQGRKELHLNDRSQMIINPKGEIVNAAVQSEPKRKQIKELSERDSSVEIFGTVVQLFEPRYFEVCPQCSKRARLSADGYACQTHGTVNPSYSYVLNAIIDDGTETIRTVFFRQQADKLLGMRPEQVLQFKDNIAVFSEIKTRMQGTSVKIGGKANKNAMFDRIEFVAETVDSNPNPEEEIKRVKSELSNGV